jgi:pilus assembly protein CpaB
MDRRFLTVLGVSLLFALVISSVFYQMTARSSAPARPEQLETKDLVIAAKPLNIGTTIKPGDVTISKVPVAAFPKTGFSKVEEVLDRPVVSNILAEEAVIDGRLAPRGSGAGLAPVIPVGMRAVTVRVNDVVGVAGFVLPGMRVDLLVTGRPPSGQMTLTTTVLQNITVLSAGQTMTPDARGAAINAPSVTLLVTPEQAEVITLAGAEGRIQLVLRNGSDTEVQKTKGVSLASLYGARNVRGVYGGESGGGDMSQEGDMPGPRRRVRNVPVAAEVAPPPPPPPPAPPVPEQIVVIRGNSRSVETVGMRPASSASVPAPVAVTAPPDNE